MRSQKPRAQGPASRLKRLPSIAVLTHGGCARHSIASAVCASLACTDWSMAPHAVSLITAPKIKVWYPVLFQVKNNFLMKKIQTFL